MLAAEAIAQSRDDYKKGSLEWGVMAGGALPVDLRSARPDRRLSFVAIEIGRVMTGERGRGIFSGQFEMLIQVMPVTAHGPEDFWGIGMMPVFVRWTFSGTKRVRLFADASAGVILVDWKTPGPGRIPPNFNEQIGLGLRAGPARGAGFLAGYKFQHISNGSRTRPSPAVDTHLLYAGVSFVK